MKPPLVYRIDIQQGNDIDQSMVNKLRVGMDERQVKFIMGTPLLIDPFHPDRWEYLYYNQESGEEAQSRHVTLHFNEGRLSHVSGDIEVNLRPKIEDDTNTEKSVVVPESYADRGLFGKWFSNRSKLNRERKPKAEDIVDTNLVNDVPIDDTTTAEDKEIINAVEADLDIENTKSEDVVSSETPVDAEYSLTQPDEEQGFFSRMWDKMTGDEPDYEFLEPETE